MDLFWKSELNLWNFPLKSLFRISICLGLIRLLECRPGPIFGLEAVEVSKEGILMSWLPGSREVEEYRLTITSDCNNWKIPECEEAAVRVRRGTEEDEYNNVEDDVVMKLLEVSYDDIDLIGGKDLGKKKEDKMFLAADCNVRTTFHSQIC